MKKYIFDDNGIEYVDDVKCQLVYSVIHWESTDPEVMGDKPPEIPLEQVEWSENRVLAELTLGGGIGVPTIELRQERIYPDGKTEVVQQFYLDPVAAYTMYLHFKNIDEVNPDKVFW